MCSVPDPLNLHTNKVDLKNKKLDLSFLQEKWVRHLRILAVKNLLTSQVKKVLNGLLTWAKLVRDLLK